MYPYQVCKLIAQTFFRTGRPPKSGPKNAILCQPSFVVVVLCLPAPHTRFPRRHTWRTQWNACSLLLTFVRVIYATSSGAAAVKGCTTLSSSSLSGGPNRALRPPPGLPRTSDYLPALFAASSTRARASPTSHHALEVVPTTPHDPHPNQVCSRNHSLKSGQAE